MHQDLACANSNGMNHALATCYENGKAKTVVVLYREVIASPSKGGDDTDSTAGSFCTGGLNRYCEVDYSTMAVSKDAG